MTAFYQRNTNSAHINYSFVFYQKLSFNMDLKTFSEKTFLNLKKMKTSKV